MKKIYTLLSLALLWVASLSASAKDYYLSVSGSDANDGTSLSHAFGTLKFAASKLQAGDVLHVSGMIQVKEMGAFAHKNTQAVTILGESPQQDGFDGMGKSSILNPNDSWVVVKNLQFANGYSEMKNRGGAFTASGAATSKYAFDNCIFKDNTTSLDKNTGCMGGAIWMQHGSLTITNSQFVGNKSLNGGALYLSGVETTISNTGFIHNHAEVLPGQFPDANCAQGGVVWSRGCKTLTFVHDVFRQNMSHGNGGVMRVQESFDKLTVKQCAFIQNTAGGYEEDFYYQEGNANHINSLGRYDLAVGGCINVHLGVATAAQCDFFANTFGQNDACASGAAIYVGGQKTGTNHAVNLINCTIAQNTQRGEASSDGGVAVQSNSALKLNFVNNILCAKDMKGYLTGLCSTYYPIQEESKALTSGNLASAKKYGVTEDQNGVAMTLPYSGAVQMMEDFPLPAFAMSENWKNCMAGVDASAAIQIERKFEGRTWESVCLPFGLTSDQIDGIFGIGTQVARFYQMEGKKARFVKVDDMEAGVPYLIYSARSISYNPILTDVEITSFVPLVIENQGCQFVGMYDNSELGKGLRAYWKLPDGISEKELTYVFDDEIVNGIKNMPKEEEDTMAPVYTMSGQYVGDSHHLGSLPKGVYIVGHKKIVLK